MGAICKSSPCVYPENEIAAVFAKTGAAYKQQYFCKSNGMADPGEGCWLKVSKEHGCESLSKHHVVWSCFFCPSPLPFSGSTVLSLTRGPAGNRTTTGSLSATQECRDTNCTTRTTMLFGIVLVLLSQAFAAWHGWDADSAAELLVRCLFSAFALAVDRFVMMRRRTAQFCSSLLMRCFFLGSTPSPLSTPTVTR